MSLGSTEVVHRSLAHEEGGQFAFPLAHKLNPTYPDMLAA